MNKLMRILYRVIDTGVVTFALWFLLYAVLEYFISSKNGALLLAGVSACCLGTFYFLVRNILISRSEQKNAISLAQSNFGTHLCTLSAAEFSTVLFCMLRSEHKGLQRGKGFFYTRGLLYLPVQSTPGQPAEEKDAYRLCGLARKMGKKGVLVSPYGLSKGASEVLARYALSEIGLIKLHSLNETCKAVTPPEAPPPEKKRVKTWMAGFVANGRARGQCVKYAVILLALSFFTPYRLYYLIAAGLLFALALAGSAAKLFQSRNRV